MKNKLLAVAIALISLFSFISIPVYAEDSNTSSSTTSICDNSNVSSEIKAAAGCSSSTNTAKLEDVIQGIINGVISVLGIVAVIFIVIGGINYMTSSGDASKTQKARNTILYAAIGLAICAFAVVITNFTIGIINNNNKTTPDTSKDTPPTVPAEGKKSDKQ